MKINAGQHTLMRVLYTPEMMKRLERGVRDRTLTPEVRKKLGDRANGFVFFLVFWFVVRDAHAGGERKILMNERTVSSSFSFLVRRSYAYKRSELFVLAPERRPTGTYYGRDFFFLFQKAEISKLYTV